jgi:hypothetical protein
MNRPILALCLAMAACTTAQQTAVATLRSAAAAKSTTATALVNEGALLCGDAVSPAGVIVGDVLVAVANAAGVPVLVTGAAQSVVAAACPPGLAPGALPPGTDPAVVPVIVTPAASNLPTI